MAELYEDASELEKLIRDLGKTAEKAERSSFFSAYQSREFENQQYIKQIDKEKQLTEASARETEWKTEETRRLQESISQLDKDTKEYHKQFTINRANCESLKKTGQVMTEHIAAMNSKRELAVSRNKMEEAEHAQLLEHYTKMWDGYKAKYESWSHVKKLREQQAKVEVIMSRMERKKAELDDLKLKVEELKERKRGNDAKAIYIKVAESYKKREKKLKIAELNRQEIETMTKNTDEQIQREAVQERTMESLNEQLKDSSIEDGQQGRDKMETNQVQQGEGEEPASTMISVFSGRSDVEEDMQTGELQTIPREDQSDSTHNQEQQTRKPQSWLDSYQEQNQRPAARPSEAPPANQIQHQEEQSPQKQQTSQHQQLQPPFVAFHKVQQHQGSEEMEASVSIHIPSQQEGDFDKTSPPYADEHTPSKSQPTTHLLPLAPKSAGTQRSMTFSNPAFQTSPTPPQFTVPILQTRPMTEMSVPMPGNVQISRRPPPKSEHASTGHVLIKPPIQSTMASNQAPVRVPRPVIPSMRIPTVSLPHQRPPTPVVQSNPRLPQNMVKIPPRPQNAGQAPRVLIPSMRPNATQENASRPLTSQAQPFLIRPPVPTLPQCHKPASNQAPSVRPKLQQNVAAQQHRAQTQQSTVSDFTAVPISQAPKHAQSRPQISSASSIPGFSSSQLQGHPKQVASPSKSQENGQREITQLFSQQTAPTLSSGVTQKSEAPKKEQVFGGQAHQLTLEQDNQMDTTTDKTPKSSPVPMQTSPYAQPMSLEDGTTALTPEHQKKGPEGKPESPFNMDKHKERVKQIKNKSPGHPLVYGAGRRMFNGGKGDSADQDMPGGFSTNFDNTASFSLFGGGDGLHVPAFGPSVVKSTGISMEKKKEPSLVKNQSKSRKDSSLFNFDSFKRGPSDKGFSYEQKSGKDSPFFNFDSFKLGPSDDSGFSFEQKDSEFNFDLDSFSKDKFKGDSGLSFDFAQDGKESQFNFDTFGQKSGTNEQGKITSPTFSFDFGPEQSFNMGPEPNFNFDSPQFAPEVEGGEKPFNFNIGI